MIDGDQFHVQISGVGGGPRRRGVEDGSGRCRFRGAAQWPVGGTFEALSASRIFFIFFAARFSFNV
jgi:hypothetical protein